GVTSLAAGGGDPDFAVPAGGVDGSTGLTAPGVGGVGGVGATSFAAGVDGVIVPVFGMPPGGSDLGVRDLGVKDLAAAGGVGSARVTGAAGSGWPLAPGSGWPGSG